LAKLQRQMKDGILEYLSKNMEYINFYLISIIFIILNVNKKVMDKYLRSWHKSI